MNKSLDLLLILLCLLVPSVCAAEDESVRSKEAWLQSYEANRVGWTFDNNDVGYMDFTVSLKYPFLSVENAISAKKNVRAAENFADFRTKYFRSVPYFAFTGRFGQYIGTRKSSPVLGKRFNPKVFLRLFTSAPDRSYLDIGYGHESNGQRIDSRDAYLDLRDDFTREGEDPEFANDYISRGWDYWEIAWSRNFRFAREDSGDSVDDEASRFSARLNLKYFLENGYLQGEPEEYNVWENAGNEGKPRKEFDGVAVEFAYRTKKYLFPIEKLQLNLFGGLSLIYITGYKNAFLNNTLRIESLVKIGSVPVLVWWSEGYNSDLVDYFRRVRSGGVALDLKTF